MSGLILIGLTYFFALDNYSEKGKLCQCQIHANDTVKVS